MAFCSNCGSLVADSDKFCGNCGTVVDTQTTTNYNPQQPVQPNFQQYSQNPQQPYFQQNFGQGYTQQYASQATSQFGIAMSQLGKQLSSFLKNPVAVVTQTRFEISALATYIFSVLMTLLLILLNFWGAAQNKALANNYDGRGTISRLKVSPGIGIFGEDANYGKLFLTSFFFVIIMLAAIWALSLFINVVILKGRLNALQTLNLVVFASIPYASLYLLATLFGYIEGNVSYLIYLAGIFASLLLLFKALGSNIQKSETAHMYACLILPVALYLLNFIFFKVAGVEVAIYYNGIFMGIF
ncbi:zinc ribbon domain-containing protein [Clostridium thermarum]|uniref:zinc ribbon domain-containing protein n=1 Tax=Clostridium thermarum TaxID=1716543 RepID=UPI00111DBA6F|nr:zinc-ribbon domain-containing protein [Clostridium thermarum]